jgi:hypothetical protein
MLFLLIVSAWSVVPSLCDPQVGPVFVSVLGEHLTQLGDFRAECHAQRVDGSRFVVQEIVLPIRFVVPHSSRNFVFGLENGSPCTSVSAARTGITFLKLVLGEGLETAAAAPKCDCWFPPATPSARTMPSLVKAVVRAHDWYAAKQTGLDGHYLSCVFRCVFLAPDIVEAILDGRQPAELTFAKLRKNLPLNRAEQRKALGFPPNLQTDYTSFFPFFFDLRKFRVRVKTIPVSSLIVPCSFPVPICPEDRCMPHEYDNPSTRVPTADPFFWSFGGRQND